MTIEMSRPFNRMLEGLDEHPPHIVEVGCAHHLAEQPGAVSYGSSSYFFARWAAQHGGRLFTIDVEQPHLEICRKLVAEYEDHVSFLLGDGAAMIAELKLPYIDLLYIDGRDLASEAADQVRLALPMLRQGAGRIVFDDCPSDNHLTKDHFGPNVRASCIWHDPEGYGVEFAWRESVCMCYEAIR